MKILDVAARSDTRIKEKFAYFSMQPHSIFTMLSHPMMERLIC